MEEETSYRLRRSTEEIEYRSLPEFKQLDDERTRIFEQLHELQKMRKQYQLKLLATNPEYLQVCNKIKDKRQENIANREVRFSSHVSKKILKRNIKELSEMKCEPPSADNESCLVCSENSKIISFQCGHKSVCPKCALKIMNERKPICPICREEIKQAFRVFE